MTKLSRWGDDHPDLLGGIWWDNTTASEGGVAMCLGVVVDIATVTAQLRRSLTHPQRLKVIAHRYTLRELQHLQKTISDDEDARWLRDRSRPRLRGQAGCDVVLTQRILG
ncbi:hypothetical protein AB0K48_08165 [Nonomuraea sp. NPDC055795]